MTPWLFVSQLRQAFPQFAQQQQGALKHV